MAVTGLRPPLGPRSPRAGAAAALRTRAPTSSFGTVIGHTAAEGMRLRLTWRQAPSSVGTFPSRTRRRSAGKSARCPRPAPIRRGSSVSSVRRMPLCGTGSAASTQSTRSVGTVMRWAVSCGRARIDTEHLGGRGGAARPDDGDAAGQAVEGAGVSALPLLGVGEFRPELEGRGKALDGIELPGWRKFG